ncbi:TIGR01777 family protein [Flavihumibacter sp. R14]|nr:TIGR01777 family protein [Flavihumibacter soli]
MSRTILISGGTGLLGKPLTRMLLQKGYAVHHLSRNPELHGNPRIKVFKWDVKNNQIDPNCISGVEAIIHLAGEGIAEKRWTEKRKQEIVSSRTDSIEMIYRLLQQSPGHAVKTIISASAIGYYGDRENKLLTEEDPPGKGFLPMACIAWEKAVDEGEKMNLRIVKLRTGIVLTDEGGALAEMAAPVKRGLGSPLGTGHQWMSWIHIQDVMRMYIFALENPQIRGTYNMTAPNPVTNTELFRNLGQIFDKKLWLPRVPALALKIMLGELSALVLDSAKVSSSKIQASGFTFNYPELNKALREIYIE